MVNKERIYRIQSSLENMFPDAECELDHSNPLELVIAVVLSAQCTDAAVNKVTPGLFSKYPTLEDYLNAPLAEIEETIRQIGLFRNKARFIKQLTEIIKIDYCGQVPDNMDDLVKLPGVGRKTANVVMSVAFDVPAFAVDTHVERVSKRLGICKKNASVLDVEKTLMKVIPKEDWTKTHHRMIFFGRYHCKAQRPICVECPLIDLCGFENKKLS